MYDVKEPIAIAENIYWVGYVIPDDPFQSHVYLIDNGEESILIDPGSKITWPETRKKILQLMPLENIKYLVCQHQDPDITACIEDILNEIGRKNKYIVTHWRTQALLKHYNWNVEFYEIEEHQYRLNTAISSFEFVLTPYMHFPGAFCTYNVEEKILFSSDIFGADTEKFQLYADNAEIYFEQMKPFHTHYMPSREIVNHGLDNMNKYSIDMIAPQHGSIIKKEFIPTIFGLLRKLEVGLFLHFSGSKNIKFLTKANEIQSKISASVAYSTNGYLVVEEIISELQNLFNIQRVASLGFLKSNIIFLDSNTKHPLKTQLDITSLKNKYEDVFLDKTRDVEKLSSLFEFDLGDEYLSYMFPSYNNDKKIVGIICFLFAKDEVLEPYQLKMLKNFQVPFNILLTKELEFYTLEEEKGRLFVDSITDSLTTLYNRHFLFQEGRKEFINSQRHDYPLSIAMLDLDNFKNLNDTYGHDVGDIVLQDFGRHIRSVIREGDQAFRYGGEEFTIVMPYSTADDAYKIIERLRDHVIKSMGADLGTFKIEYRFSAGIQERTNHISLDTMIKGADEKLYISKENGRDKITI